MIGGAGTSRFGAEADLDRAIDDVVERDALPLPPYPGIAFRIAELVRAGDYCLHDLAKLVRSDPALAASLLRVANSSHHGTAPIASLEAASARVGEGHLEQLALASAIGASALARGPLAPLRRLAWQDALSAAVLSRELARERRLDPDVAFTCGLLHDLGRVAAIGAIERIAAGSRAMPARFWEDVVDRHHVRLGGILAERWALPPVVRDAIALHHEDDVEGAASRALVKAIQVVDAAVRLVGERAGAATEDLAAIAALSGRETSAFARVLRVLPSFLASLDRAPQRPEPGLLEGRVAPRRDGGAGVRVRIAGTAWVALGIGPHQLAVRGEAALPEGGMVEVEVLGGRRLGFHARVLLTWPDGTGHGALLMPFGLSGPALLDWQGLVPASAIA